MAFELRSRRIKNALGEPEVYIYYIFPKEFRIQCNYIIKDVNDVIKTTNFNFCDNIYEIFTREKGIKNEFESKSYIEYYIDNSSEEELLDFLDFIFNFIEKLKDNKHFQIRFEKFNEKIDLFIFQLNTRFKQHNLGYEFVNGEILRIDNKVLHQNVIKPALKLLTEQGFEGAEQEFLQAFDFRKKGDNKNAILEALKSFESTMKTICDKKGYTYNPVKDTACKLINILETNKFYPTYLTSHLTGLRTSLEGGLPTLRNKESGHGQGATVVNVSDEFAEYALNLAATNIVLLVKIYANSLK